MKRLQRVNWWLVWILFALYAGIASGVFAFRHPKMTDTERFLHTVDALLWRKVRN